MNVKKMLVSLLVAMLMLMQVAVPMQAAEADAAGYEKAVEVLTALEIVEGREDGEFHPEEKLTRAEMATIIVRVMQMGDWEEEGIIFEDVDEDHWAFYPITTAYRAGIVQGVSATHFSPDTEVTGEQAVKMVVAFLGYTVKAEALGGYPAGYLACAMQLELLKGVKEIGSNPITRGDMARLVYNALETEMLIPQSYGEDANGYFADGVVTPLEYYMHITRYEGMVTAGYVQEITAPARELKKDEIVINNTIVKAGETEAAEKVGEDVVVYAKEVEDTLTAVALASKSTVETISASEIIDETEAGRLVYVKDGVEKKVTISGATVLYNGKPAAVTGTMLMPDTGFVKLVYTGSALKTVIVENYENYMISRVVKATNTVDVYENRLGTTSIIFEDDDAILFRKADGADAEVKDCKEFDILSIARSTDGKYSKAILTSNVIRGAVTETSTDSVIIGETEYPLAKSLTETPDFALPELGLESGFSLNMQGQIAGIDADATAGKQYGWLVSGDRTDGLGAQTMLKIFMGTGEMKIFALKETVKVNGTPVLSEYILEGAAPVLTSGSEIYEQLIQFRLNGDEISEIDTATDFRYDYNNSARHDTFSLDAYIKPGYKLDDGTDSWIMFMGGTLKSFGRNWLIREESQIFVIPGTGEDKDYYMKKWDSMYHGTEYVEIYDDVAFYDIREDDFIISVMVWDRRDEATAANVYPKQEDPTGLVKANTLITTEDGELVNKISIAGLVGGGADITAPSDFEVLFGAAATNLDTDPVVLANGGVRPEIITAKDIKPGDVVSFTYDNSKNATKISVEFRGQTPPNYESLNSNGTVGDTTWLANYGSRLRSYGTVKRFTKYGVVADVNLYNEATGRPSGESVESIMLFPRNMYQYNLKTQTLKTITQNDIEIGDTILYITKTTVPCGLVVYK